ncbi:MAG: Calx-beta domain-containing protein, partial [candidate division KSB1 bacterium]|nr:Calx-beta domain-containing protein [candidate division KSB1 bacterium]
MEANDFVTAYLTFDGGLLSGTVTVRWHTKDGSASSDGDSDCDNDYLLVKTTQAFSSPRNNAPLSVSLVHDDLFELDETFTIVIDTIVWTDGDIELTDDRGTCTIENDDSAPTFYINNTSIPENFHWPTWRMNHIAGLNAVACVDAYYEYSTSDGSAVHEGKCADYIEKLNYVQKIPAGETISHVTYIVNNDAIYEPDETVNVTVHRAWWDDGNDTPIFMTNNTAVGTIQNDDAPPTITIVDTSSYEDSPNELNFLVYLSHATAWDVYFTWHTMNGTAIGSDDYVSVSSSTVMIKGDKCHRLVYLVVEMTNDVCLEQDETIYVKLSKAWVDNGQQTPLTISDDTGEGTLLNDDAAPVADFTANKTVIHHNGSLAVRFINLSTNAEDYLWDFGDGTFSTEKNPFHRFYNPPHKWYDIKLTAICEGLQDVELKKRYITVHENPKVAFNAAPIAGPPGMEVHFTNNSGGSASHWWWDFGNGQAEVLRHGSMDMVHPASNYMEKGVYSAGLYGYGNGGNDMFVVPNFICVDSFFVDLVMESGSDTYPGNDWDNAIDHDVISLNAT